ncbi:MAG: hypothetical protein AB1608_11040 [Thermoproteota archaeon]
MILDIDHIALSSTNFDVDLEVFKKLGYNMRFEEKNIQNLGIKKKLMKNHSTFHDLCLITSKKNLNIELLNHYTNNLEQGFITPIFENLNESLYEKSGDPTSSEIDIVGNLKAIGIPVGIKHNKSGEFTFNKLIIHTNDMEESKKFWKELGFQNTKNESHFAFNSILSDKKYELYLCPTKSQHTFHLDDKGWNCVALVTNSISNEKRRLAAKFETTEIESIMINNIQLQIFFARSPGGEIIELISINR